MSIARHGYRLSNRWQQSTVMTDIEPFIGEMFSKHRFDQLHRRQAAGSVRHVDTPRFQIQTTYIFDSIDHTISLCFLTLRPITPIGSTSPFRTHHARTNRMRRCTHFSE